jgi:2-methylisocitrate lyase-like PEP mutase family enzyme
LNRYNDTESFSKPSGFTNKEEVMKSILDMIRSSIANKIEDQKIRIRNVSTSEVITVEELVKIVKGTK